MKYHELMSDHSPKNDAKVKKTPLQSMDPSADTPGTDTEVQESSKKAKSNQRQARRGGKKNNPHAPRSRARRRAIQALYQWQLNPDNAALIVSQFLDEQDFNGVDVEYFRELLQGVECYCEQIDEQLSQHLDRQLKQVDPLERAILRLSAFELVHRLEVPVRVVLDEAVELARRFGSEQGHSFVNGVLDPMAKKVRATEIAAQATKDKD